MTNCGEKKQITYGNKSKNNRKIYSIFNREFHRELEHGNWEAPTTQSPKILLTRQSVMKYSVKIYLEKKKFYNKTEIIANSIQNRISKGKDCSTS